MFKYKYAVAARMNDTGELWRSPSLDRQFRTLLFARWWAKDLNRAHRSHCAMITLGHAWLDYNYEVVKL